MGNDVRLSTSQKAAIKAPWKKNMLMILSTAGSGKTLVLTRRAIRIAEDILESGKKNQRILCLCFNLAMAEEMHIRIGTYLLEKNLAGSIFVTRSSNAATTCVTIEVRTFHSFGLYILHSALPEQRMSVGAPQQTPKILQGGPLKKSMCDALKRSGYIPFDAKEKTTNSKVTSVLKDVESVKCKHFDAACEKILRSQNAHATDDFGPSFSFPEFEIYERQLLTEGALDLNDLLWKAVRLALKCPTMRHALSSRYASILVDEFQDVSASQLVLCKILAEKSKSLSLIGDDDQQIYSWRSGNDWFCHKAAKDVFSSLQTIMLPENRRCSGNVVRGAYAVIRQNSDRAPKEIVPVRADGAPVRVIGCKSPELERDVVVRSIQELQKSNLEDECRILVLFRTNELLNQFEDAFDDVNVPTTRTIHEKMKTYEVGASTLQTVALIALVTPSLDVDFFAWAACTIMPTLTHDIIQEILTEAEEVENEENTNKVGEKRVQGRPLTYREQLMRWYSNQRVLSDPRKFGHVRPIYTLIKVTDAFWTKIASAQSVTEIVLRANGVIESTFDEISDELTERGAKEYISRGPKRSDTSGYNLLVKTAEKIDVASRKKNAKVKQSVGEPIQRVSLPREINDTGGSDLEDFSELFASDAAKVTKKRRRAQGVAEKKVAKEHASRDRESLERDLCDFCSRVWKKLGYFADDRMRRQHTKQNGSRSCVVLSTAHNSKGSTFDHVFLCGANRYNFPLGLYAAGIGNQPPGMEVIAEDHGTGDENDSYIQEERRVFFVAMTRAVKQLTCTYSGNGGREVPPKQFESIFVREMLNGISKDKKDAAVESFVSSIKDVDAALGANGKGKERNVGRGSTR